MVLRVTNTDPNAKDELIGQQVGASYTIIERLGEGGMGLVYLAESTKIGGSTKIRGKVYRGKVVAVKVLTARSKDAIARFRAEAYAAGKVDKFSVVDILDAGELATGQSYILMEYCDGGSLQDLLQERGTVEFAYDEILSILAPVCAALVKAHEANLVHRDIKPANILFVKNGKVLRARLSDFGLVKLREHDMFLMTARNSVMGTPGFMSPEQCVDTGTVDGRSDIYSVGCVLYQLLTGRLPYAGTMNDLIRQAKENAPIAPPSVFRRNLPPGWEQTTMRCLAFRREDRFQTALEAINNLADGLENGRSLMGFHAPILVEDVALGPTANTITSAAGGPAAKVWTNAQSQMQQRERSLQRRSLTMFIAGIAFGALATSAIALTMRTADEADAPRVAPAPTSPSNATLASLRSTPTTTQAASSSEAPTPARPAASSSAAPTTDRAPASANAAPSPARPAANSSATPTTDRTPASSGSVPPSPARTVPVEATPEVMVTPVVATAGGTVSPLGTAGSATTQPAAREAIAPTPRIPTSPPRSASTSSVDAAPSRAPTKSPRPVDVSTAATTSRTSPPSDASNATEAWLSIRVKGFAEISIDGDAPGTSPRRKRVRPGVHHVVMTGYPDGSEKQQRKEFDVIVPPGKDDDTVIFKTW